ncbi:MAG: OmpH family outer membrane protein [Bryobacteraceae bacterium]
MKKSLVVLTTLVLGFASSAFAQAQAPAQAKPPVAPPTIPTKIAIINMAQAIASTKEGQKAATEINNKFAPRKTEYDKRNQEIEMLTNQLNNGRATMSDEAQKKLAADIQAKGTALKRYGEDAQAEMENDDAKVGQELQSKMGALIQQYAIQNGYAVVLNYGDQQSPVLWAAAATWITDDMVKLYDQVHPVKEEAPTKPPAKPPVAPVVKKQ